MGGRGNTGSTGPRDVFSVPASALSGGIHRDERSREAGQVVINVTFAENPGTSVLTSERSFHEVKKTGMSCFHLAVSSRTPCCF